MLWLRRREAEMRDLNEATNTRVTWLSIMTLIVCVGLCVWQVVFLNQFFQRKKLL
jgi:phosphatidylinositol glycan class A protein